MAKFKVMFEATEAALEEIVPKLRALGIDDPVSVEPVKPAKRRRPRADIFWKGDQPFIRIPAEKTR